MARRPGSSAYHPRTSAFSLFPNSTSRPAWSLPPQTQISLRFECKNKSQAKKTHRANKTSSLVVLHTRATLELRKSNHSQQARNIEAEQFSSLFDVPVQELASVTTLPDPQLVCAGVRPEPAVLWATHLIRPQGVAHYASFDAVFGHAPCCTPLWPGYTALWPHWVLYKTSLTRQIHASGLWSHSELRVLQSRTSTPCTCCTRPASVAIPHPRGKSAVRSGAGRSQALDLPSASHKVYS